MQSSLSQRFSGVHDHDFARRDDIERSTHLSIEEVGIDMVGPHMGDPMLERHSGRPRQPINSP